MKHKSASKFGKHRQNNKKNRAISPLSEKITSNAKTSIQNTLLKSQTDSDKQYIESIDILSEEYIKNNLHIQAVSVILQDKLVGSIDACDEKGIGGWVLDKRGLGGWQLQEKPIQSEIDIFIDNEFIARTTANSFRQDLADALIGNGCCAFYLPMPERFFDNIEHSIEIRESNNGLKIESKVFSLYQTKYPWIVLNENIINNEESFSIRPENETVEKCNALVETNIAGSLDACDQDGIKGWAMNISETDILKQPVTVDIYIDDEFITSVTADTFRQDLLDAGFSDGKCAFGIAMPDEFFDNIEHKIDVRENSTNKPLTIEQKFILPAKELPFSLVENIKERLDNLRLSTRVHFIFQSGLFNYLFYKQQTGIVFRLNEAIEHYLNIGADCGFKPMPLFEADIYRLLNPDLSMLANSQCFVHYVLKGRTEKRYYNKTVLKRDASELRSYPDFDSVWYGSLIKDFTDNLNCYEHYLAIGWRQKVAPNRQGFDSDFYQLCNLDAQKSDKPPFLHYLSHNKKYISNTTEAGHLVHVIYQSGEFDSDLYKAQYQKDIPEGLSDILHYICHGVELKLDPNSDFCTEYYIRKYPDIFSCGINPFIHYLTSGKAEGRSSKFDAQSYIHSGKRTYDFSKPTVLVVCHEASRTGAPILGLRLIENLVRQANIISWNGKEGPLTETFAEVSVAVINTFFDHIDNVWMIKQIRKVFAPQVAIVNSSVAANIAMALHEERVPVVALIHEYGDYMGIYSLQMLHAANKVVFPSEGVKSSVDLVSIKLTGTTRTESITVRHQGRCIPPENEDGIVYSTESILSKLGISEDDEKPAIVFGCGWVQIRKGVEYFIEAARLCKNELNKPVRFIWVGAGYKPDTDIAYSVWLRSQIINSNLEKEVVFFDETPDLSPFFELADVFFLSSRLDPFPNVAIDAVDAGVPIIAFERGTGFAEFINSHSEIGVAVPFLDVHAAAKAICQYITGERIRYGKSQMVSKLLSFANYSDFVWSECQSAIVQQQKINKESELLIHAKLMDTEFFESAHPWWDIWKIPEYVYVDMWVRGIRTAKSKVGFNDKIAQTLFFEGMNKTHTITPLAYAFKSQTVPLTHNILYVNPDEPCKKWQGNKRVVIHIHAYYIENLPILLDKIGNLSRYVNLCITTNDKKKAKEIDFILKKYSLDANIEIVPNRGRDIGPFIMMMKKELAHFEIVGHFHLKGTKELEESVVRQWQDFLYDSLIGKQGEIANILLNEFEQQAELGFLFQEDPCLSSWGNNLNFANKLLESLGINYALPESIEYPMGNMFWARTSALKLLMKRDWQWHDFPSEPVPYDGSILHAIERLMPFICQEAGYKWATVHNPTAKRYCS